jgi:RNA polymerase sigma factor (sigma-70 family)
VSRQFNLSKVSSSKIEHFLDSVENNIVDHKFFSNFEDIVFKDVKMLKDCSETFIVDYYIEECKYLLNKYDYEIYDRFYEDLKERTRKRLVNKYVSKETFDNNIDIYFNEVKREYILHPMGESEDMLFVPENKEIFIKNNLKLVIDCAKRYQNLGLPLEDLIQAGNEGLLVAFEKFDTDRSNLRTNILNDIKSSENDKFTLNDAEHIIRKNFKYTKILEPTLKKLPEEGFETRNDFIEWANANIKKASFSSIGFAWIKAMILSEIGKVGKIIRVPKSAQKKGVAPVSVLRLDSMNPHTEDTYHDNQISNVANEEFVIEDEIMENMERQNLFKEVIERSLGNVSALDRRIIKKKFGIDKPFPMSINEIAENEGISPNKVKYSIINTLKAIEQYMPAMDKKIIKEMLQ